MIRFIITGHVVADETGAGMEGLFVKAYDKDLLFDDLLGTAFTGPGGAFEIVTEPDDFREFFDNRPDIYFRIYGSDKTSLIHTTEKGVRWNSGPNADFTVRIPSRPGIVSKPEIVVTAGDGIKRDSLDAGESLTIAIDGLMPVQQYQVNVAAGDETLFSSAFITDSRGSIPSSVLWPQFGLFDPRSEKRFTYAEAVEKWKGKSFTVSLHYGKEKLSESKLKFDAGLRQPLLFTSDPEGRLLNGFEEGSNQDLHLAMHNIPFKGDVRVYLVPRQHDWNTGDSFAPASWANGEDAIRDISLKDAHLVTRLATAEELRPGAYDFIVRPLRYGYEENDELRLRRDDLVTRRVTGFVLRNKFMFGKTVLGGCVNKLEIAGRNVIGQPYFRYSDTFTLGEDIYAALDPAIVDPNNISKMCAYYIIPNKTALQWNASNALNHLAVLGGNAGVVKVLLSPGCVNHSKRLVWPAAMQPGEYDLVADFGNNTSDAMSFTPDNQYNTPLDAIDGYFTTGFRVVEDPGTMVEMANTGSFTYLEADVNGLGLNGTETVQDEAGAFFNAPSISNVNVPMRALVYFPSTVANATLPSQISLAKPDYPLVVIVHGNGHSYTSYDDLLLHFARNGFIAASIHLNTGMGGLGRANIFFKHLAVLNQYFPGKIQNNIGVMGHSRGGEAMVKIARLNQQQGLGHNLNALISLAPTDRYGYESLSGAWSKPYLVIYGSRDGDVAGWNPPTTPNYPVLQTGFSLYDRASGNNKSMVFVYGATHNGFITTNENTLGEAANFIQETAQFSIVKAYMNAFFRMHLRGETVKWEGMFKGEWKPGSVTATGARLFTQYQDTVHTEIDHFESGAGWQTSSIGAAVDDGGTLPVAPDENKLYDGGGSVGVDNHSPHDSKGLKIRWDSTGDRLDFSIPPANKDVSAYSAVSIRISQKTGSASNPANLAQNLRIALKDGSGNERRIRASAFAEIPYPDERADPAITKSALCSVRIPLRSYNVECAGMVKVDLTDITTLSLYFSETGTGEIDIDNVEFTN